MEKKQILIAIILVALVAIIGINFEEITGEIIYGKHSIPIVSVYRVDSRGREFPEQNEVKAGEKIRIKVKVGQYCVDPDITFHKYNERRKVLGISQKKLTKKGASKICKPRDKYQGNMGILDEKNTYTIDYRTELDWEGVYAAKVYYWQGRTSKKGEVAAYFTVT